MCWWLYTAYGGCIQPYFSMQMNYFFAGIDKAY